MKRGSSDSNLPKIDTAGASVFQPHHVMVCVPFLYIFVSYCNALLSEQMHNMNIIFATVWIVLVREKL